MSDHDRGAYTPQNEAPLSFDARRSRGRRAFPTTLIISLVILAGLGVAIFMFYRSGVRGAGEAPVPVGSPVGDIKSPPSAQAQQPQDPGQGLQIYKAEGNSEAASGAPSATAFAPPPEQPQPRAAPTTPVTAQPIAAPPAAAPKPSAPAVAVPAATPAPPPAAAKPASVAAKPAAAASKPAAKDEVGALLGSKPAQIESNKAESKKADAKAAKAAKAAKPAKDDAPAPAASAVQGAALVQFGAFSSSALAASEWTKLAKAYPSVMAGKGKQVEPVERDGKTLYRGAVSGFASKADAVAFCAKLKADSRACIVK
jgi:hypothetical protein